MGEILLACVGLVVYDVLGYERDDDGTSSATSISLCSSI